MTTARMQAVLAKHGINYNEVAFNHIERAALPLECSLAVQAHEKAQLERANEGRLNTAQRNTLDWQKERERSVRHRNEAVARNPFAALAVTQDGKVVLR